MVNSVVSKVYYTFFTDFRIVIIQNVTLGKNGIVGELAKNEVIEDECVGNISRLHLNDKEGRGNKLIDYLLDKNDVDRYEGFLDVWGTHDADTIRKEIHKVLKSEGLKVPERWAKA